MPRKRQETGEETILTEITSEQSTRKELDKTEETPSGKSRPSPKATRKNISFSDFNGSKTAEFVIYRINDNEKYYLAKVEAPFSEEKLISRFGGGNYHVVPMVAGKLKGHFTVKIDPICMNSSPIYSFILIDIIN